jgi:hypothetical protein
MSAASEPTAADADVRPPRPIRPDPRPGMDRLLTERGDLRGVYPTADYLAESIRWSA